MAAVAAVMAAAAISAAGVAVILAAAVVAAAHISAVDAAVGRILAACAAAVDGTSVPGRGYPDRPDRLGEQVSAAIVRSPGAIPREAWLAATPASGAAGTPASDPRPSATR